MAESQIKLTKCPCQHCSQKIEFEAEHAGETVLCPNCRMETMLFVPPVKIEASSLKPHPPKPKESPKPRPDLPMPNPSNKTIGYQIVGVLMQLFAVAVLLFGISCFWNGVGNSNAESKRIESSAIRDIDYQLEVEMGVIQIVSSPLIFAAGRLLLWLEDNKK